jgi:pimeloyl-ACP methyl ester carboxylesterase
MGATAAAISQHYLPGNRLCGKGVESCCYELCKCTYIFQTGRLRRGRRLRREAGWRGKLFYSSRRSHELVLPGLGKRKTLLFVHSWGFNADLWQYQMIHLTGNGLRCIAFDRRGHGRSSDPGRGYTCDRLADDLAAVIEQLDLRDLTLVGHSMGCAEMVRYLARHGAGRVSRLVLAAPSLPFRLKAPDNPDGVERSVLDDCVRE